MKKILSTLAIAGVATLALASCNGDKPTPTGTGDKPTEEAYSGKLTVWCSTSDGVSTLFKEKGEAWLKANGYENVTLDVTPVSEGDAVGKVLEDLDAAPDIYCFAQDQLSRAVTGNAIAKVPNTYLADVNARNSQGGLTSGTVGETLYAYPLTNDNGYIMMYDKSVMEGVDMTDMTAIIAKCNATGTKFSHKVGDIWTGASFFFALDEEGNRLCTSAWQTDSTGKFTNMIDTFNSDNGLIALKGMNELVSADCFMNSSEAADFAAATPSSVVFVGSWGATAARDALGENFAATVLPKFTVDGKKYQLGSFSGSKLMGVKPQTDVKKAKAAHALANYLSDEEIQTELFTQYGWGGTNKKLQATDAYKSDIVLSSLVKQADYAVPQGQILGAWWTIGNAIYTHLTELKDKSDASLKTVLQKYYDDLTAAFNLQGDALWVGSNQGVWNNADPNSILEEKDGLYTITVTFTEEDTYKGGRIVKPASWDTLGSWANVDAESMKYLDETKDPANLDDKGNSVNGDGNLVFKEAGTYVITFDLVGKKITITKQ